MDKIEKNRELKFRAWHKEYEEYYEVGKIDWDDGFVFLHNEYDSGGYDFADVIIEQYTGFKDKNGVEIYEGDIVELGRVVYKVKYLDAGFKLISRGAITSLNRHCKVVGNINENPERKEV